MPTPEPLIRRLTSPDTAAYRELRLEALRKSPEAFGRDYASESAQPIEHFARRLENSHVLGAFDGNRLIGMAGISGEEAATMAHKAYLWGVYVRPAARNAGVARRLAKALIDHARQHYEIVYLTVERGSIHARRLYTGLGFAEYGLERNGRKVNGTYYDDILMALDLRRG